MLEFSKAGELWQRAADEGHRFSARAAAATAARQGGMENNLLLVG